MWHLFFQNFQEITSYFRGKEVTSLLFGLVVLILVRQLFRKRPKLPPGPICLPILGYWPFLKKDPEIVLGDLAKKYGNVVGLYIGPQYVVFLNDWEALKDALGQNATTDRPPNSFGNIPFNFGFASFSGTEWIQTRRVTSKAMKDIGLQSTRWEELVQEEVKNLVERIEKEGQRPLELRSFFAETFTNNILTLIMGERLSTDHPLTKSMSDGVSAILENTPVLGMNNYSETLSKILEFFGLEEKFSRYGKVKEFCSTVAHKLTPHLLQEIVEYALHLGYLHRSNPPTVGQCSAPSVLISFGGGGAGEAFFDSYVFFMQWTLKRNIVEEKLKNLNLDFDDSFFVRLKKEIDVHHKNPENMRFTDDNQKGTAITLLTGGSHTVRAATIFTLIAMADHPHIQQKVQEEIDRVVGKEGFISWAERFKIPYTFAAMLESMRWKTVAAIPALRCVNEDIKVQGYDIPKGTFMTANNWALHSDPRYWSNPDQFIPERFLLEDGTKVNMSPDSYNPFSYGKRNCPGKLVALMENLQYFVMLMQKFKVVPKEGDKVKYDMIKGLAYEATNAEIRFIPR